MANRSFLESSASGELTDENCIDGGFLAGDWGVPTLWWMLFNESSTKTFEYKTEEGSRVIPYLSLPKDQALTEFVNKYEMVDNSLKDCFDKLSIEPEQDYLEGFKELLSISGRGSYFVLNVTGLWVSEYDPNDLAKCVDLVGRGELLAATDLMGIVPDDVTPELWLHGYEW